MRKISKRKTFSSTFTPLEEKRGGDQVEGKFVTNFLTTIDNHSKFMGARGTRGDSHKSFVDCKASESILIFDENPNRCLFSSE